MLVVNLHTLQTVYVLDFINDVFLYSRRTLDGQDVSRSNSTIRQRSSGTYIVVLLYQNLLGQSNQIFLHIASLGSYDDLTVTTLDLTHSHFTVDFRYNCRVRRISGFEQLSNTRKTTGDITRLTYGTRNLNQNITSLNSLLVFYHYVTSYRKVVSTDNTAVLVNNVK